MTHEIVDLLPRRDRVGAGWDRLPFSGRVGWIGFCFCSADRFDTLPPQQTLNLVKKGNCVDHFPGCLPSENFQF